MTEGLISSHNYYHYHVSLCVCECVCALPACAACTRTCLSVVGWGEWGVEGRGGMGI